ncbi:signal peptidase I [Candidatus Babeliales bacterium]|nr:signal peptidase I [Candidatus Babeliales bacterium]
MASLLQWRFESLERKFLNNKKRFLIAVQEQSDQGNLKEARVIEKAIANIEEKISILRGAYQNNSLNSLQRFFRIRALSRAYRDLNEGIKPWLQQLVETVVIVGTVVIVLQKFFFTHYNVPTGSAEPNILVGDRIWGNKLAYRISDVKRGDLVVFDNPLYDTRGAGSISRFMQEKLGITIPLLGIGPDAWVKRVVGLPGDVIEGRIEDGKSVVYRNGEKLYEPYKNPFPLIAVKKHVGLIDNDFLKMVPLLSWIGGETKEWLRFTYDPEKSLEQQPFYSIKEKEILRNMYTGEPFLYLAEVGESHDQFGPMRIPEGKYWMMGDNRKNSMDCRVWGFLDESKIQGRASFITFSIDSVEPLFLFELLKHPIDFWIKKIRWSRFGRSLHPFKELPKT